MALDFLGYIGAYAIAVSAPCQLYKSWKYQSTRDIAWPWMLNYFVGILMLWIYAVYNDIRPVWIPMCLEISSTVCLISLKLKLDVIYGQHYTEDMSSQTEEDVESGEHLRIIYPRKSAVNGALDSRQIDLTPAETEASPQNVVELSTYKRLQTAEEDNV
jgi:hypothetical protein